MPDCCICYMTDPAYLFPTLVSAIQARRMSSAQMADVAIFSFDADLATQRAFERVCAAEQIHFTAVDGAAIEGAPAMLARLFLTKLVPAAYAHFLYIDGDTQIRGSLDPLVGYEVPSGKFLAANDPMTFAFTGRNSHDRKIAAHFQSAGFSAAECGRYFNSGVMRMNRDGWGDIEAAALKLYFDRDAASRFPDQDVLNLVGRGHSIPMSLAWNFPIFMLNAQVEATIAPRIYHFMSKPKPWEGVFPPWKSDARRPYLQVVRDYPAIADYVTPMPAAAQLRYQAQQRYKRFIETFTWRLSAKRAMILDYERNVAAYGADTGLLRAAE